MEHASADEFFLTKMLNPAITPTRSTSPGFSTMTYTSTTNEFTDVAMTFLDMDSTYMKPKNATYADFEWMYVDYDEDFGLQKLTGNEIYKMHQRMAVDTDLYAKYMSEKQGLKGQTPLSQAFYQCLQLESMYYDEAYACEQHENGVPLCDSEFIMSTE